MYNRYIPQPDGTYRKNRMPEPEPPTPQAPPQLQKPPVETIAPLPPEQPDRAPPPPPQRRRQSAPKPQPQNQDNVLGFLKQLLPKNMDTGDLMIILLLLLMAGDREEDRSNALLTLALYFFM